MGRGYFLEYGKLRDTEEARDRAGGGEGLQVGDPETQLLASGP